jgi:DNA-directed RNA polymerase specialized sigma24 family protein
MSDTIALRLELNHLLKDIPGNREQIFLAMHDLAKCKVRRIHFRNPQDAEDAVGEAVLYAMGRLHKYNPGRHAACAYFGLMLSRHMLRLVRKAQDEAMVHDGASSRRYDHSVLDAAPARRLPRGTAGRWRDSQVRDAQERHRVKAVLDEALEAACDVLDSSAPGEEIQRAELTIGLLQHVRKALLGRFNRIQADQQRQATTLAEAEPMR